LRTSSFGQCLHHGSNPVRVNIDWHAKLSISKLQEKFATHCFGVGFNLRDFTFHLNKLAACSL
ncbi:hypothetical protein, partial [Alteromonas macleodii]|uniref:hypothetical protein n=1 Tax=Alteromonas macleodii TaxID=28108 RepID=UPI00366009BA